MGKANEITVTSFRDWVAKDLVDGVDEANRNFLATGDFSQYRVDIIEVMAALATSSTTLFEVLDHPLSYYPRRPG